MLHRLLTSLTLCAAAGGLFAEAAPAAGDHPNAHANAEKREKCLAELKQKHPELYAKIDANGDGDVSGPEFGSFIEHRAEKFKTEHPDLYAAIDTNGDGKVDKDELQAAREARDAHFKANHPKGFEKADQNGDGKLQPGEAHEAREKRREHQEKEKSKP